MEIMRPIKYVRTNVGKLLIFSGFVLVSTEIYLGWLDGVWNRYPFSMLVIDTIHFAGKAMEDMFPKLQLIGDTWKSVEISDFPLPVQFFLNAFPMASFFLFSGYVIWPKDNSRAKSKRERRKVLKRLATY